jgi:ABC-type xylose transport system permease subunit
MIPSLLTFVVVFILFSLFVRNFGTIRTVSAFVNAASINAIVVIGVTLLMISGEFDLSVGSLLGISGLTFLGLMTGQFPPGGPVLNPVVAALVTLVFVGCLGAVNGLILIRTGIPSFIVTLATLLMLRGIPLVFIAGGRNLRYVDYFNDPPMVDISRVLIVVLAALLAISLVFVGRSLLQARLNNFRQRQANYSADPGDFRTLSLIGSGLYLAITVLFVGIALIVLVGSIFDQISHLTGGSPFLHISFFDHELGTNSSLPIVGGIHMKLTCASVCSGGSCWC